MASGEYDVLVKEKQWTMEIKRNFAMNKALGTYL
jgi:hypothetical protein